MFFQFCIMQFKFQEITTLIRIYIHQILSKQTNMVTSRTNGDYWATTFINSGLTTQETMPYMDATTSYDYETNEVT
jgi:hypothetical protein